MYERVGGRPFFERLVDTFYDGVAGDECSPRCTRSLPTSPAPATA